MTLTITDQDTVYDVLIEKGYIFAQVAEKITREMKLRQTTAVINLCRFKLFGKRWWRAIETTDLGHLTLRQMNTIQVLSGEEDHFFEVIEQVTSINNSRYEAMSLLERAAEKAKVRSKIMQMQFLSAFRVYLDAVEKLQMISKAWNKIQTDQTAEEKRAKIKRPDRGLTPLVQELAKMMNGSISYPEEAWNVTWDDAYILFESHSYSVREQKRLNKILQDKNKVKKR